MTGQGRYGAAKPVLLILFLAAAAAGCSTAQDTGSLVDAQGNHPANFVSSHPSFAGSSGAACRSCHGDDLRGGIAKVSCFSASFNGVACHASGPAFHPTRWLDKAAGAVFHGNAYKGNVLINGQPCSACHDAAVPSSYNCLECHFNEGGTQRVPTGSSYVHGSIGGHDTLGRLDAPNATTAVCMNCHDANNRFGHMPTPFCHNCHAPAPPSYHAAGWAAADSHGRAAKSAPALATGFDTCRTCHGSNFTGGNVGVSCFSCHGVNAPHPRRPWRISGGSARTHTDVNGGNAPVCANCHAGGSLSSLPPPPTPPAGTPPGCFNNTLCHGQVGHAVPFLDPAHLGVTQPQFDDPATGCSRCHAVSGTSPVPGVPSCQVCHTAGSPLSPTGSFGICTSCHGYPPDGAAGAAYPNIAAAHAKHLALPLVPMDPCDTCHNGLGFVTPEHYDRANARPGKDALRIPPGDLLFDSTYDALSGSATFDNIASSPTFLTCSNVICHGGQTTPNWQTETITTLSNAGCRRCHKAATQAPAEYNDVTNVVFPRHVWHAFPGTVSGGSRNISCTTCHNTAALTPSLHFGTLDDPTIPAGAANATILTSLNWNPTPPVSKNSCTTPAQGCH